MDKKLLRKQIPRNVLVTVVKMTGQYVLRLDKLVRELIAAEVYRPETTHQLRILSNKCGAAIRVLNHAGMDFDSKAMKNGLRRLRQSLSLLRDADIRLNELQAYVSRRKTGLDDALIGAVHFAWSEQYREARSQITRDWPLYRKSLDSLRTQCKQWSSRVHEYRWKRRHDRWVSLQLVKWIQQTDKLIKNDQAFHVFRIQTKRLRYLLQSLLPQRLPDAQRAFVILLEQLQRELGRYCDLKNMIAWLDQMRTSTLLRQDKLSRLIKSLNSWRKVCEQALRRQEKQLLKYRSQFSIATK